MLMRLFQVSAPPGKQADFSGFFHDTALPMMRATPGIVSVTAGAPRAQSPTDFCRVTVWQDPAALKAFVGENCRGPHGHPGEAAMLRSRGSRHSDPVEARAVIPGTAQNLAGPNTGAPRHPAARRLIRTAP